MMLKTVRLTVVVLLLARLSGCFTVRVDRNGRNPSGQLE